MRSSVKSNGCLTDNKYILYMDINLDVLRRRIWQVIHQANSSLNLSDCDISMVLGIIQYELIHHSDEVK